jgi:hypothetical protein
MNTPLDGIREHLGLRPAGSSSRRAAQVPSPTAAMPDFPTAVRARGNPEALNGGTRRFLGVTTMVSGVVALTHQLLADALAAARAVGVLGLTHSVLAWPAMAVQPALAGVAAFGLCLIGVPTRGWRRVTPRQGWYLFAFTLMAILGAGPMVLVCVVAILLAVLAMLLGMMIFSALLALLIAAK